MDAAHVMSSGVLLASATVTESKSEPCALSPLVVVVVVVVVVIVVVVVVVVVEVVAVAATVVLFPVPCA